MNNLELIPAKQSRSSGEWSEDDYDVVFVESGESIGMIFRMSLNTWFWGIDDLHCGGRGSHYGSAGSKDAAKRAFADCWFSK